MLIALCTNSSWQWFAVLCTLRDVLPGSLWGWFGMFLHLELKVFLWDSSSFASARAPGI